MKDEYQSNVTSIHLSLKERAFLDKEMAKERIKPEDVSYGRFMKWKIFGKCPFCASNNDIEYKDKLENDPC